jgi:hypothetical protein
MSLILGWIARIYDTLLTVLRLARAEGISPHAAADRLAGERLAALAAKRRQQ